MKPGERRRHRARLLLALILLVIAVALQALEWSRFPGGLAIPTIGAPSGTGGVLRTAAAGQPQFDLVTTIGNTAPGSDLYLAEDAVGYRIKPRFLHALSEARSVTVLELTAPAPTRLSPSAEGLVELEPSVEYPWRLFLGETPVGQSVAPPRLLIVRTAEGIDVIDVSLLPEGALPDPRPRNASLRISLPEEHRAVPAGVREGFALLWLLTLGGLMLPRDGLRSGARVSLAFITGTALVAGLGVLHIPYTFGPVSATLIALVAARWLRRRGLRPGWDRTDVPMLAAGALVIMALSIAVRARGWTTFTPDSFQYLTAGHALANGNLTAVDLDMKRPAGQGALHAVGSLMGVDGLLAVGLVLLLASAAVVALLPRTLGVHDRLSAAVAMMVAGLALTSAQMITLATYVNSHILVASLLLLLGHLSLVQVRTGLKEPAVLLPAVAAISALLMLRAESILLVGLVLLGALPLRGPLPWRWAWSATAAVSMTWAGTFLVLVGPSTPALILLIGGILTGVGPAVIRQLPARAIASLPAVIALALWAVTVALLISSDVRFLDVARINLWEGRGRWGVGAPVLLALAVGAALHRHRSGTGTARWPLIGFVPVTVLAKLADGTERTDGLSGLPAALLGGGGRLGWGDSTNRMWSHIVLVVLFLTVLALMEAPVRRRSRAMLAVTVVVVSLAVVELARWEPQALSPGARPDSATLIPMAAERPLGPVAASMPSAQLWAAVMRSEAAEEGPSALRVALWRSARWSVRNAPPAVAVALLAVLLWDPATTRRRDPRDPSGRRVSGPAGTDPPHA